MTKRPEGLRYHRLDDVLVKVSGDLLVGHGLVVLRGDEDGVHTLRYHGTVLVLVGHGHLSLAVRAHPRAHAVLADLSELGTQLSGEHVCERHQLRCLIGGVAEHVALVTRADLLECLGSHAVNTCADVRGLLLDVHQHLAVVSV
eukprot:scaffold6254_cov376-Prasinococcus_capsulatus_cf.AAC.2